MGLGDILKGGASAVKGMFSKGYSEYKAAMFGSPGTILADGAGVMGPVQSAALGSYRYYRASAGLGAVVGAGSGAIDGMFNSDTSVLGGAMGGAFAGALVGAAVPAALHYGSKGFSAAAGWAGTKAVNGSGSAAGAYNDFAKFTNSASNMITKYGNKPYVTQGSVALATLASTGVGARVINRNKRA